MKRYLLDTQIFLWWLTDDSKLGDEIRSIISDPENSILVSVATAWEISNKLSQNKKLQMSINLKECFAQTDFEILPVKLEQIFALEELPLLHSDMFDRILVAQAIAEELILISVDEKIAEYFA